MFSLSFQLVAVSILKFKMRRIYGGSLIGFYILFLILAILTEVNVIPVKITGVITDWFVINMNYIKFIIIKFMFFMAYLDVYISACIYNTLMKT